nr:hypothetical protein [Tanacetum cinerariifolium]
MQDLTRLLSTLKTHTSFTPDVSVIRNENGQSAKEIPIVVNAKVMNNSQDVYKEASCDNVDPNVVKKGGSVLGVMEDMIWVRKVMGYSMDGCVKDLVQIIGRQGVGDDYVSTLIDHWNGEVVVLRDFNEVWNIDERRGSCFNPTSARVFDQFISASGLVDVKMKGYTFTWSQPLGSKMSKLDSFLVSEGIFSIFPSITAVCLDRHLSNHRPIILCEDLKVRIRAWIKDKRLSVSCKKDSIKKELSDIDRILDGGNVFDSNLLRRSELHHGIWCTNPNKVKEAFFKHFEARFKKPVNHRLKINFLFSKRLSDVQASDLERSVSRDEIRLVVYNCRENKSPGPDGYSFEFFKKYWNLVGSDLCDAITDAKFVNNFQSISLIGSVYKVVTKKEKTSHVFKVDFAKAYDSIRWDYLLDVLEAFGFGNIWCKWIRGTFSSAKASVLINGSPTIEFPFHCGLKQGDPLSPYLFILIMESLNMSFTHAIDEGVFKGVHLHGSTSISHLFYADDVMVKINIQKSQVLGVSIPSIIVMQAASSIGYLGVMVGECMSRHNAWASTVDKLRSRLSKWKVKTLSIGGRLTLLKAILGASPLYNMSIFKVPKGILNSMEAIRCKFFNGMEPSTNKITWAAWNKVLASKENGGLGVSIYHALNRALILKWVWHFISQDGSLWFRVIKDLYGTLINSHPVNLSSNWCSIIHELHLLVGKGFHFLYHCKKRIGNGRDTCFWYDKWLGDKPLKDLFPCLFALELNKEVTVADKVQGVESCSFRHPVRAGSEYQHLTDLNSLMETVSLSHSCDRWICDLSGDGEFRVKEVHNFLDNLFLPSYANAMRWVKYILLK